MVGRLPLGFHGCQVGLLSASRNLTWLSAGGRLPVGENKVVAWERNPPGHWCALNRNTKPGKV
jgi:hypothetical protein